MKVLTLCCKCADEGLLDITNFYSYVNYNEEVCYYICPNGHKNYYKIANNKYELLYDSAIVSYHDGYFRETVMNLFSCLESFQEYVIRLLLFCMKDKTIEQIEKFIKNIKSRSECRDGCFYGMCGIYLNKEYFILDKYRSLRNQVIHNGYFPEEKDAKEFAKYTFEFICSCYGNIKEIIGAKKISEFDFLLEKFLNKNKYEDSYQMELITTMLMNGYSGSYFEKELEMFNNQIRNELYNEDELKEIKKFLIEEGLEEIK